MANGNGAKVFNSFIIALALLAIGWGYSNARSQGETDAKLSAVEKEVALRATAIHSVPVIETKVGHINNKVDTLDEKNDAAHQGILIQMEKDNARILRAIDKLHTHRNNP